MVNLESPRGVRLEVGLCSNLDVCEGGRMKANCKCDHDTEQDLQDESICINKCPHMSKVKL